jgi:hypothetical protein
MIFLVLAASTACAGFVMVMTITPPFFPHGNMSATRIELINTGDLTAIKGVVGIIYPPMLKATPVVFDTMGPGINQNRTTNVELTGNPLPGTYPFIVMLRFSDASNYPIYMIYDATFDVKEPGPSKINGTMDPASISVDGSGVLTLKLKNEDSTAHDVKVRIFAPDSISATAAQESVQIPPGAEAEAKFTIANYMALPGSQLDVLATAEYEDNLHRTTVVRCRVGLKPQEPRRDLFPFEVAVVILIFAAYAYYKLRKPKKKGKRR